MYFFVFNELEVAGKVSTDFFNLLSVLETPKNIY